MATRRAAGLLVFLTLGAAFVGCAPLDLAPVLLEEDFSSYGRGEEPYPVWDIRSGDWEVRPDGLLATDCRGGFIAQGTHTGNDAWQDYRLSLRLRIVSRGSDWRDGPWIGFRHRNAQNAYTLGFYNRETQLHKASEGRVTDDDTPLASSPTAVKDEKWHRVTITAIGSQITVDLDGKPLLTAEDKGWNDSPPVASGGIVLSARTWEQSEGSTQVLFDDVKVEAIGKVTRAMKRMPKREPIEDVSLLEFIRRQRHRRYTDVPRKVLAFYYTWYGTPERQGKWIHWADVNPDEHDIATSTHYPALGAYDSHDPEIIETHIREAKTHGIDAFITTWWGAGGYDDRAFRKVLDRAEAQDFEATIYWETVPGKGRAKIDRAVDDLCYVLDRYADHPAFLTHDGTPVIFIYGRVMNQVELSEWPTIIAEARRRSGRDVLLIADGYRDSYARIFDGLHVYNICAQIQGQSPQELATWSQDAFADAVQTAKQHGRLACITIIPGYDDTKIRTPGINARRQDGETYRVLWKQAIAADPDWVVITSWNEWHEGSEIEPSHEHGDKYLQMTGLCARRFKQSPRSRVEVPETLGTIRPETAEKLRQVYQGKTIGLLPDFAGDVVFWLADSGVSLKELAWEDLLDPETFNPEKLPVVLYAGGERYAQTIVEEGDGDAALQRYLRQGGLLVALSHQPFPFYYTQDREVVVSAYRLGFPIAGSGAEGRGDIPKGSKARGWEEPPEGVTLKFQFDTSALKGIPESAPFPKAGDPRWRPCTGATLPKGDRYIPLARLVGGDGTHYGDGIAYIHHRASEPKGGKNLYVWMRMPDVVDRDALLFQLFRFAAEKVGE
jgi:hypothetical protein